MTPFGASAPAPPALRERHLEGSPRPTVAEGHGGDEPPDLETDDPIPSTISGDHRRDPQKERRHHGERDRVDERLEDDGPPVDAERVHESDPRERSGRSASREQADARQDHGEGGGRAPAWARKVPVGKRRGTQPAMRAMTGHESRSTVQLKTR